MRPGRRGAVLLALSWAVACAGGEPESHPPLSVGGLTVRLAAGGLIVSDTVAAGWRRVQLEGIAGDDHNLVVFRIPDGMSPEAFVAAIDTAATTPFGAVALGGPDGASTDAMVRLEPGTHLVACLISGRVRAVLHGPRPRDGAAPHRTRHDPRRDRVDPRSVSASPDRS